MSMRASSRQQAQSELCAAVFQGHETLMIYSQKGLDLFKPAATFMEGFALVHVANRYMDVVLAQAGRSDGGVAFTNASSKRLA